MRFIFHFKIVNIWTKSFDLERVYFVWKILILKKKLIMRFSEKILWSYFKSCIYYPIPWCFPVIWTKCWTMKIMTINFLTHQPFFILIFTSDTSFFLLPFRWLFPSVDPEYYFLIVGSSFLTQKSLMSLRMITKWQVRP